MATRGTNTMQEALQRLLGDIAQMKTLADADLAWMTELESMVLAKIREPLDAMRQSGMMPQPTDPSMGMPGGMGGGGPLPGGTPMGGGMMAATAPPNANELQRLLNAGAGVQ